MMDIREMVEDSLSRTAEEEWLEFKENWSEPHAIGEYISALSNAAALKKRSHGLLV